MKIPWLHLKRLAYWKIEPQSPSELCFLLKLWLEIDCVQMVFCHRDIDKISLLRSTHRLSMKFLVDFCQQQNTPVVDT